MGRVESPLNIWMHYLEGINFKELMLKYTKDAFDAGVAFADWLNSNQDISLMNKGVDYDMWKSKYSPVFPIDISYLYYIEKCLMLGIEPVSYKTFGAENSKKETSTDE